MKKIIIAVLSLGLISALMWVYFAKDRPVVETDTVSWKIYENKDFGYSFKYPERFAVINPLAPGYTGGNILVDPDIAYITVYVVTTPHPPLNRPADVTIDGHSAVLTPPYGNFKNGVNIFNGENLISLHVTNNDKKIDENTDNLIRKIISTIDLSD